MSIDKVERDLSIDTRTYIILTKGTAPEAKATMKRKTYMVKNVKPRTDN